MAIAITLDQFLSNNKIHYDLIKHHHTDSSFNSAVAAHLDTRKVCKAVILQDADGNYLMAVIPTNRRLLIDTINRMNRRQYHLIGEHQLGPLFQDCELGAIPGMGQAYNLPMMLDDALLEQDKVYIEAGDHEHLLGLEHADFIQLTSRMPHGRISGPRLDWGRDIERNREWQ